jgi:CRP-like cAMP-binding protein
MAEYEAVGTFVASLDANERIALDATGRIRNYRRGQTLFREGDSGDAVYVLTSGQARLFTSTPEGNEVTLCVRAHGDLVGEMAVLDPGSKRSATMVALGPLCCRVIRADAFRSFLESHPRATLTLVRLVIARLRDADRRRTEFGSYDATHRLARVLLEAAHDVLASEKPGVPARDTPVGLSLSQQELAGLIGASRESVARALAELRRRGLVSTGRREIVICDSTGLRHFVD